MKRHYQVPFKGYGGLKIREFDRNVYQPHSDLVIKGKTFGQFIAEQESSQRARGGTFFDGPMVAVSTNPEDVSVDDGNLTLKGVATTYFRHAFLRGHRESP